MSTKTLWPLLFLAGLLGCEETPRNNALPADAAWADAALPDSALGDGAAPDAERPDALADDALVPDAAMADRYVELTLNPRKELYSYVDRPQIEAVLYNEQGQVIRGLAPTYTVTPPGTAQVSDDGLLTFLAEGAGSVSVCFEATCGLLPFFVDDAAPVLTLHAPERGAILGGDASATVQVRGTAVDSRGPVEVRVNGIPVEVGEGGAFSLDLPARFGVNTITVTADDGVRRPAVRDQRDVLFAPSFLQAHDLGVDVPQAITLRLEQSLLDANTPFTLPEGLTNVELDEFAQVLSALIQLAEVSTLIGDPQVMQTETLALRVEDIRLGEPEVELAITASGIDLFVRLPNVELQTSGFVMVDTQAISLSGVIRAGLAAYAPVTLSLDGTLRVDVGQVSLSVESLSGEGLESASARALLETFSTRLHQIALGLVEGIINTLIQEQLPGLISDGINSLLSVLSYIPIHFEPAFEGMRPIDLGIAFGISRLTTTRHASLQVGLDAALRHPERVAAPHPDPGVPVVYNGEAAEVQGDGLTGAVRLSLINGLLHEVWRGGTLQMTPPLPGNLAGLLGEVQIDARLPPVVAPTELGSDELLEVQLGDLRMRTTSPLGNIDEYALTAKVGVAIQVMTDEAGRTTFKLEVSDEPQIDAVVVQQASPRLLLTADALANLVESVVWPMVEDALGTGLEFAIEPIAIDPSILTSLAPRLTGMSIRPRFSSAPRVVKGRVELSGGLGVGVSLQ